jgi:hypothetical protein
MDSGATRALLCTTHINQAEILYGIRALPEGRKRTALTAAAMAISPRILPAAFHSAGFPKGRP